MPSLRKSGGGVMEGTYPRERRAIFVPSRIPESGRHPGFRERVTLRGVTQEREPWSAHEDGGSIQPAARRIGDTQGCSRSSVRRGTFTHVVLSPVMRRSGRREGGSFAQGYSARAVQRSRPTAIAANDGRIEASPASGVTVGRWLSGSFPAAFLQRRGAGFGRIVTARSARDSSSRGEDRHAPKGLPQKGGESERTFDAPRESGPRRNARIGCSGV
jgi:hypothetical protein